MKDNAETLKSAESRGEDGERTTLHKPQGWGARPSKA